MGQIFVDISVGTEAWYPLAGRGKNEEIKGDIKVSLK
jgi:hypothetical protein